MKNTPKSQKDVDTLLEKIQAEYMAELLSLEDKFKDKYGSEISLLALKGYNVAIPDMTSNPFADLKYHPDPNQNKQLYQEFEKFCLWVQCGDGNRDKYNVGDLLPNSNEVSKKHPKGGYDIKKDMGSAVFYWYGKAGEESRVVIVPKWDW